MGEPTKTTTYRLREEGAVALLRGRIARRIGAFGVPAVCISLGIGAHLHRGETSSSSVLGTTALLMAAAFYVGYRIVLSRELAMWRSYRLTLWPSAVRREVDGLPLMLLKRSEVTKIVTWPGRGITVMTAEPHRNVFIAEQLERFDEARDALAAWAPLEPVALARALPAAAAGVGVAVALIVSWGLATLAPSALVVAPAFAVFAAIWIWMLRAVLTSPQIPLFSKAVVVLACMMFSGGPVLRMVFLIFVPH